jgi:isochorismate pyruvate lyase
LNVLSELRDEIDVIDKALVELIAKRFQIVDRVVGFKRGKNIPAHLPDRIEQVVQNNLRNAQGTDVPTASIEKIWRTLIAETIAYEQVKLNS